MHQTLYAALDAELPRLLRVAGGWAVTARVTEIKAKLLHLVWVTVLLVALDTEIKVLADGAVVASLH